LLPVAIWLLRLPSPPIHGASEDGQAPPVDRRLLALIVVFFIFQVGAELSYGGWIYLYGVASDLISKTAAYYLTSAFWAAFTLGRLLSIPIALRLRPSTVILGGLVGCLAGLTVMLMWPNSPAVIWLGTIAVGMSLGPLFPTAISLVARRMAITGAVVGWFFVGASLGSMSMPWIIGQLFEPVGPQAAIVVILVDTLLALGVFLIIKLGFPRHDPRAGRTLAT